MPKPYAKTILLTIPFPNSSMVMTSSVLLRTLKADPPSIIPRPQGWGLLSRAIQFPNDNFHSLALPQTNTLQSTPPSPFQTLGGDNSFPSAVPGGWERLPVTNSPQVYGFLYPQSCWCRCSLAAGGEGLSLSHVQMSPGRWLGFCTGDSPVQSFPGQNFPGRELSLVTRSFFFQ